MFVASRCRWTRRREQLPRLVLLQRRLLLGRLLGKGETAAAVAGREQEMAACRQDDDEGPCEACEENAYRGDNTPSEFPEPFPEPSCSGGRFWFDFVESLPHKYGKRGKSDTGVNERRNQREYEVPAHGWYGGWCLRAVHDLDGHVGEGVGTGERENGI